MISTNRVPMLLVVFWFGILQRSVAQDRPGFEQRLTLLDERFVQRNQANLFALKASQDSGEQERIKTELSLSRQIYVQDLLALAQTEPRSKAVPLALRNVIGTGGTSPEVVDAIEQLRRDWLLEPEMAIACGPLWACPVPLAEALLRDVLARNPDRTARGQACFALANRLDRYAGPPKPSGKLHPDAANLDPQVRADTELQNRARRQEARGLYERIVREFADVKQFIRLNFDEEQTIGTAAEVWLGQHPEPAIDQSPR